MAEKTLPFSQAELAEIIQHHKTPFHIYDEKGIRENARRLLKAFSWAPGFKEYFAVKATPNPYLLEILKEEGIGADCSSLPELLLCERAGITGEEIIFSSNNTPAEEYQAAYNMGAIINLDDISHIEYLEKHVGIPEMISFRYNPGPLLQNGNDIIGYPEEAKYGLTKEQIFEAYKTMQEKGAKRFGIHTMVISNELNPDSFVATAVAKEAKQIQAGLKKKETPDPESYEAKILKVVDLIVEEKALKAQIKTDTEKPHLLTKKTIENLTDAQVYELLELKWITPLVDSLHQLPEQIINELAAKVQALADKYATTYKEVVEQIHETEKSLTALIDDLTGSDFDMQGLAEFQTLLKGE